VLRGAIVFLGPAAGNRFARLVVVNQSSDCTLFGFSGLQLVAANGNPLPTKAVWDLPPGPSLVNVPANGIVMANMQWGRRAGRG
jgi:hypothetical protein